MTRNQKLETSREIRQWLKMGAVTIGGLLYLNYQCPGLKEDITNKVKSIFKRKEKNEGPT